LSPYVFFELALDDRIFRGSVGSDGPLIEHGPHNLPFSLSTSIERVVSVPPPQFGKLRRIAPNSWCLAKCGTQPRIELKGLTAQELQLLAHSFGAAIEGHPKTPLWHTPAFAGLKR
jgi:hypothetical protein